MFAVVYLVHFPANPRNFVIVRYVGLTQLCAMLHCDPALRLPFLAQCQKTENYITADIAVIFVQ